MSNINQLAYYSLRRFLIFAFAMMHFINMYGQQKNFELSGYLSGLYATGYDNIYEDWSSFNKVNNRMNLNYWFSKDLTITLELQNRLYTGSALSRFPGFSSSLTSSSDYLNISHNWVEKGSLVFQSRVDRIYLDYTTGKVGLRVGRQRINWSQTLVWNVNDIFNSYSIFEIDNLEKYGCDAMRLSIYTSPVSLIEAAVKMNDQKRITSAIMTRFNYKEIDFQFQSGIVDEKEIMFATGFTGDYKGFTLRAEGAYYIPANNTEPQHSTVLVNAGLDYIFSNNMVIQGEVLFNQLKQKSFTDLFALLYAAPVSSKTLSISEWSYALNWICPLKQRFKVSFSSVFFPDYSGIYLSPSVDIKLIKNLEDRKSVV